MDWTDVGEIVERVSAAARRRGATQAIEVSLAPDLPLAFADPILLEQALGNVVENAVRHAGPTARIAVSASAIVDAVRIVVEDDGPGIPVDVLPHVFEKFVRASRDGSDGGEGSGLGLAIAKGIADAHGGAVVAESPVADGHGTRVTMVLPKREATL
jgi:two-component system sensor histidine kinase KdpD